MKIDKTGKFWALIGALLFWSAYVVSWFNQPADRASQDIITLGFMFFTGIYWFSEEKT